MSSPPLPTLQLIHPLPSRPPPIILRKCPLLRAPFEKVGAGGTKVTPGTPAILSPNSSTVTASQTSSQVLPPKLILIPSNSIDTGAQVSPVLSETSSENEPLSQVCQEEESEEKKRIFCLSCPATFSVEEQLKAREHYIDHFLSFDTTAFLKSICHKYTDKGTDAIDKNSCTDKSTIGDNSYVADSTVSYALDHNYFYENQEVDAKEVVPRVKSVSKEVNDREFLWISRFIKYQVQLIQGKIKLPSYPFKDCLVCERIAIVHNLPIARIRFYRKTDYERHFRSHLKYGLWYCKLCKDYSKGRFYNKWLLKVLAVPWSTSNKKPSLGQVVPKREQSSGSEEEEGVSLSPASQYDFRGQTISQGRSWKSVPSPESGQSSSTKVQVVKYRKIKEATKFSATRSFKPHYKEVLNHIRNHHLCKKNKHKNSTSLQSSAIPIDTVIGEKKIPFLEHLIISMNNNHFESFTAMKSLGMKPDPSPMACLGARRHFYTITEDDWNDIMEVIESDKENDRIRRAAAEESASSPTSSGIGSAATSSSDFTDRQNRSSSSETSPVPSTSTSVQGAPSQTTSPGLSTDFRGMSMSIWRRKKDPNSILAETPTSSRPFPVRRSRLNLRKNSKLNQSGSRCQPSPSVPVPPVFGSRINIPWKRRTNNSAAAASISPSAAKRRLFFDQEKSKEQLQPGPSVSAFGQALSTGDSSQASKRRAGRPLKNQGGGKDIPIPDGKLHPMVTRNKGEASAPRNDVGTCSTRGRPRKRNEKEFPNAKDIDLLMEESSVFGDGSMDDNGNDLEPELMSLLLEKRPLVELCPRMVSQVLSNAEEPDGVVDQVSDIEQ